MKKISLFAIVLLLISCFTATCCFAEIPDYYPSQDGKYTITYDGTAYNEYIIIVLKGVYDETNYIEAYNAADDKEIMYYEQLSSDDDGLVTFGPFVPMGYFDSTVIIGGTDLKEPVLAGYVRSNGFTGIAGIELGGVAETYTVNGALGQDVVIDVEAVLMDAFGYPAITDEKAILSVETELDGVTVDSASSTVTIDRYAENGEFVLTASYGELSDSVTVEVVRKEAVPCNIVAFINSQTKKPVTSCELDLVDGEENVVLMLYSETRDQFGNVFEDARTGYVDGVQVIFETMYKFNATGDYTIKLVSVSDEDVFTTVAVKVKSRPAYEGDALTLYNFIKECEAELELIGVTKFVSADGKDVYPADVWTTQAYKDEFEIILNTCAKAALFLYNMGEVTYDELASVITDLEDALDEYLDSFKAGKRVDITSLEIQQQNMRIPVTSAEVALKTTVTPAINTDKLTWVSSDPETVTVDENGKVVAKKNGTVTITATTKTGISASTTITAYTKITQLQFSVSKINLVYGDAPYQLKVTAKPAEQSEILTWTSSNPSVATVDASGRVTAQKKAGTTRILVKGEHGVAAECEVSVTLPAWETAIAPVSSVAGGNVYQGTKVELSTATENAQVFYTLDGSTPTEMSRLYVNPITINSDMTIKAIAIGDKMYESDVVTFEYTIVSPAISISDAYLSLGNSITLDVALENNFGIKSLTASLKLPKGVTLTQVETGEALSDLTFTYNESLGEYILMWNGENADSNNGVAATLTLFAAQNAPKGEFDVNFTSVNAIDKNGKELEFDCFGGKLKISDVKAGDVNNDSKVNIQDVILLAQYCAGWESAKENTNIVAADTNGDSKVNIQDVVRLAQYCAGWDVTIG